MTTLTHLDAISDRALHRMIKLGAIALAVLTAGFAVIYYLGQRVDSGPNLVERQVSSAEDALKANPQNVNLRLALASTYQQAGRFDEAMAQYDEILKAVPTNTTAMLGEGTLKVQQGDLDGAKGLFTKLTTSAKKGEFSAVDPQVQAAYYWLGSIAAQQGKNDEALKALTVATRMDDSDADSWYLLGSVQSKSGNQKDAVVSLRKAIAFVPTGWCDPYPVLASAYAGLKQQPEADYANAMNALCTKDVSGATQQLTALTTGPAAVDAMLGLGLIGELNSDRATAKDWYHKVLKADPVNASAKTALVRLGDTTTSTSTQTKAS